MCNSIVTSLSLGAVVVADDVVDDDGLGMVDFKVTSMSCAYP